MEQNRKCLYCGEPIIGRTDKKFCSDYCRNAYHNERNRTTNRIIRQTNRQLKKNWQILSQLNPEGKTKVHRKTLEAKGFRFDLYTHCHTTKKGDTYFYIYDQGYLPLGRSEYFLLVTRDVK